MSTIDEFYARKPASFGPIVSFLFTQHEADSGEMEQWLEICLSRHPDLGGDTLSIRFMGVRGLWFKQPEFSLAAFGAIFIEERPPGRWVEISYPYLVTEEEDNLQFECKSFEIVPDFNT